MQGKQFRKLEAELWRAAYQLRANSKLTASEYSMPVLGLIFLRHAYNRYQKVKIEVEKTLPSHPQRGKRPLTKKDFEEQNSMFLPEKSQFEYLVSLPESADLGEAIDNAMKLIEDEYDNLKGVLPKNFSILVKTCCGNCSAFSIRKYCKKQKAICSGRYMNTSLANLR